MGTFLILDDEDQVRESLREQLETLGQDVYTSSSAIDALELIRQSPGKFDAVLVDLALEPGDRESGIRFLENARKKLPPEVGFYLMSAYAITPKQTDSARTIGARWVDKANLHWGDLFEPQDFSPNAPAAEALEAAIHRATIGRQINAVARGRQYYSCFISYSSKDEEFARKLYQSLRNAGVECWFAPESMKIGALTRPTIDRAIQMHEKLVLILSKASVSSQWVEQEVEKALERERQESDIILLPIRVDGTVFGSADGWASYLKNTRYIGDFSAVGRKRYEASLKRLLEALEK